MIQSLWHEHVKDSQHEFTILEFQEQIKICTKWTLSFTCNMEALQEANWSNVSPMSNPKETEVLSVCKLLSNLHTEFTVKW